MAYAALLSLGQTIDLILNNHQDSISPQLKDETVSVHKYVIFLQAFLENVSKKANTWEERIRELAYVAEDIIDFLLLGQIHGSSVGLSFRHQPKGKHEHLHYDFHELKKVTKEIESIAKEVMGEHKGTVVGFDNDLMEIKIGLCGESSKLEIIPIVGMGGIGKTTLARYVYDDQLIKECFDIRAWVSVSQNYSVPEIVSGLLVSMKVADAKSNSTVSVYQNLIGRRYLTVLDDMWSTEAWDDLKIMFPDDSNGSRIILTTRLSYVASYVSSSSLVHKMNLMDEEQSWNLLRQKVFKQDPCPDELVNVGKMIAISCRGLPLAIVVISGILNVDRTEAAWWKIAENVKSAISANDEQFDDILSLSYTHLPHHLRPCFLYVGGFPEDYEMRVSKLIKLWVADGFLEPNRSKSFLESKGSKSPEETAEEFLEELDKRNLILVTKRKSNGRIKCFTIHDLMRELCIRIAQEESFFLHVCGSLQHGIKIPRRVSVIHSDLDFLKNFYCSTIHTIICLEDRRQGTQFSLRYFRLLRILDLVDSYEYFFKNDNSSTFIPAEVFDLFHLRYLAFDYPFSIPAAISNLRNLQTLIISSGNYQGHFVELPAEIWRMRQLRHIIVLSCLLPLQEGATLPPENLQTLSKADPRKNLQKPTKADPRENLQTLTKAVNFVCSEKILEMIPNLKKLGIFYTVWRDYEEDYQLRNLTQLQKLEDLKIEMYNFPSKQQRISPAFPGTLKKLALSGLRLPWEDMKIVGSLPKLEVLKLRDDACVGDTWETTEGEFPQLKFLLIDFSDMQNWTIEDSNFQRLKCLVLRRCWCLIEIPDGFGEILTLELIEVDDWNESLLDSAKQIQDDQQSYGNNALQVRCIREFQTIVDDEQADQMLDDDSKEKEKMVDLR